MRNDDCSGYAYEEQVLERKPLLTGSSAAFGHGMSFASGHNPLMKHQPEQKEPPFEEWRQKVDARLFGCSIRGCDARLIHMIRLPLNSPPFLIHRYSS